MMAARLGQESVAQPGYSTPAWPRDSAKIQLYECMLNLYTADCYLCDGHAEM